MTVEALEIQGAVVSYGDAEPVLKGVSLSVNSGEFIALLGASGCGKTTLLRAISGFVRLRAGAIRVSGVDIAGLPPDKRDMAMVFQSYALWPHMTTAQNIGYGLRLRRQSRSAIAQRVRELLSMLGLEGLGERKVTQLSGGQRQRVALGRALAVNPRILLLDEPLSNLDAKVRAQMRHEIKAIQQSLGITAIHVTHDREEAMVMADRIVILNEGYIVQQGTPEEIYNRPATPFVASFTGVNNVVALDIGIEDSRIRVAAGEHNAEALLQLGNEGRTWPNPRVGRLPRISAPRRRDWSSERMRRQTASRSAAGSPNAPIRAGYTDTRSTSAADSFLSMTCAESLPGTRSASGFPPKPSTSTRQRRSILQDSPASTRNGIDCKILSIRQDRYRCAFSETKTMTRKGRTRT